jgi:hypothetical protein
MGESLLVRRGGTKSGIIWLYRLGEEYTDLTGGWVEGYVTGTRTLTKNADSLQIQAVSGVGNFVTNNLIDLTNIRNLYISWEATQTGGQLVRFSVSANKTADAETTPAAISITNINFSKVDVLDVSGLSGSYYLKAREGNNAGTAFLKVYCVWGEML